ncbi:response regulator transcription factor [Paenibacillus humicola]|uniref:response regulator transcription factor n=1 Tax=Paenibacillus humicola TaxID=3110540 RepID=UPI00237A84CE|nr:response regulator transcription factor [Paenibacillus humicola]
MDNASILIIEDDKAIADLLVYGLNREGFRTSAASTGAEGLRQVELARPDALVLDWMLPDMSGLDLCRKVTSGSAVPILMLTARSDIADKVLGLEFGADDYLTKPFDLREVAARIRTLLRRIRQAGTPDSPAADDTDTIRFKDIELVKSRRIVRKNGRVVELTPKEFDLLRTLCEYRGKIFTRAELLEFVWGSGFSGDARTVDTHIQRLRKRLDVHDWITTAFGIGYKFEKRQP